MGRNDHKVEVNKLFADNVMVDYVVPHRIEQSRDSSTCQIAKNLLREYSTQGFYVKEVNAFCYDIN